MRIVRRLPKYLMLAVLLIGVGALAWRLLRSSDTPEAYVVAVEEPKLSALAARGKAAFEVNCAACHGQRGSGTEKGPPISSRHL